LGRIACFISKNLILKNIKVVTSLHNPDYSCEYNSSWKFKIRKLIDITTGKMINRGFIAVSKFVKEDFEKECKFKNIQVIYNGIDLEKYEFQKKIIKKIRKILFAGRFEKRKGIMELLKVFQILKKQYPYLELIIAGDGALRNEMEDYICDNHLEGVKLIGYIKNIPSFLGDGDLFVVPSYYEGFGIVIIEAMAVGIPVIATNVTAIPEIIQDGRNGFLIRPRSVKEIVSGIERVIEMETEQIRDIVYNGRKTVENKFDIEKSTQLIEKYYNLI